jgi:hypothetical protein
MNTAATAMPIGVIQFGLAVFSRLLPIVDVPAGGVVNSHG